MGGVIQICKCKGAERMESIRAGPSGPTENRIDDWNFCR